MNRIRPGVWPTMITPFAENGKVDYAAIPAMVDWYAAHGCHGLFAVCQSSEMFHLTLSERVNLAKAVLEAADGRLEVIASGHISDDLSEQVDELGKMGETGVKAVVMVSNRMAGIDENDEVWMNNTQKLLDALPNITFGLYECPFPYKRLLTDETTAWCAQSGRFAFLKDTCCDAAQIRRRIQIIQAAAKEAGVPPLGLYNANSMTLLESLRDGAAGFSGVMGNMHPELYVWLFEQYVSQPQKAEQLQSLLTLLSSLENHAYPICAKQHMIDSGISISLHTRVKPADSFTTVNRETLRQAYLTEQMARQLCGLS